MGYTHEDILIEYKALKEHFGHPPPSRVFFSETRVTERQMPNAFGSNSFYFQRVHTT